MAEAPWIASQVFGMFPKLLSQRLTERSQQFLSGGQCGDAAGEPPAARQVLPHAPHKSAKAVPDAGAATTPG